MFEHRYPGTDLHEIDLAYILGEIQALKYKLDNFVKENTFHLADPLDWNITTQYSACTIVRYNDDRLYLSAKPVPAGIQITNTEYWLNLIDCSGGGGGDYQEREVSFIPTEAQQLLDVYPEAGYDALSKVRVIVQAISNLFVGSGIPRRSSVDLTASGAQVSAPSGYYANAAVKSVQAGTEGTPTATKGPVSNHAIAVTPAVTNTEGYIAGGTKTGSAVSVTAAELVSGSQTIQQNGTVDVTNLASVTVAVPGSTPTLQTKSATFTPTESTQTQTLTADQGYDALDEVDITVNPIPSQYIVPTGTLAISQNGTFDVTQYASASVNVSGGDDTITKRLNNTLTEYSYNSNVTLPEGFLRGCTSIESISFPALTSITSHYTFAGCNHLESVNMPELVTLTGQNTFEGCNKLNVCFPKVTTLGSSEFLKLNGTGAVALPALTTISAADVFRQSNGFKFDLGPNLTSLANRAFYSGTYPTIILRCSSQVVTAPSDNSISGINENTTVYIPKALYDHLNDGTSLDYRAAANWSAKTTTTFASIEGSQYENYYADGTPIT